MTGGNTKGKGKASRRVKTVKAAVKKVTNEVKQELNREIAQKARESGARAIARVNAESPYLRCILDPEAYGPVCYPDDFGGEVTLGKFVLSKNVIVDSNGDFSIWASPCLNNTLRYPQLQAAQTPTYTYQRSYQQNNDDPGHPKVSIPATIGQFNYVNLPEGPFYTSSDGTENGLIVKENTKIQLPPGYTACTLNILAAGTAPFNGTTLSWQIRIPGGTVFAVTPGTPLAISTGLEWFQIQVSRSAGSAKDYLKQLQFTLTVATLAKNGPQATINIPDYDIIVGDDVEEVEGGASPDVTTTTPLYTEYRPVAMSLTCSFVGNELYNGGTIAAIYLQGGDTPQRLDYPTYEELAQVPGAFSGPLKTGAYGWWYPTDPADVSFREPNFDNGEGGLPSIYMAGKATDAANTQIRLRLCLCVEAKTTRQLLVKIPSVINPDMIDAASKALQSMPHCMENPLHLEKIARFLKGVVHKGEELWQRYQRPVMAAVAAAKTVAPLFMAA